MMPMQEDINVSFRSILLGTDLSSHVRGASRYAALLAKHYDAVLIFVHAFTLLQPAREVEALNRIPSRQRRELEEMLAEEAAGLIPRAARSKVVLEEGRPTELIAKVSKEEEQPTLIVLGTHGGGSLERHVVGSVAEGILRTIESPVLTVGPHAKVPPGDDLILRRILYATDFSLASTRVATYAFALAQSFSSNLDVLHVVPEDARAPDESQNETAYRPGMEQLVPEHLKARFFSRMFVEYGAAHQRIIEHARQHNVDLIVLGAHHHSNLAMHLRTGPAFRTVVEAPCPVLTICV